MVIWKNIYIPPTPGLLPCLPHFNINYKKKLNENYVEFDFRIGNVLVIFSFFWTDNASLAPQMQNF